MCTKKIAVACCVTFLIAFSGVTHSAGEDLGSLVCRDESAIHTVAEKWSFKPATSYGQPVDYPIQIEITFETD